MVEGFEEALSGIVYRFAVEEEVMVIEFAEAGVELVVMCAAGFGTSYVAREFVEF